MLRQTQIQAHYLRDSRAPFTLPILVIRQKLGSA